MPLTVRVGNNKFRASDNGPKIAKLVEDGLFQVLNGRGRAVTPSPEVLKKITTQVREEGIRELNRLVTTASAQIGAIAGFPFGISTIEPFSTQTLSKGARPGDHLEQKSPFKFPPPFRTTWHGLGQSYLEQKARPEFFADKGVLKSTFHAAFHAAVFDKLGGVTVGAPGIKRFQPTSNTVKGIIAQYRISIFPRGGAILERSVLGRRAWDRNSADAGKGRSLERYLLGAEIGKKLLNRQGSHRALVAPLLYFWLRFRIPRALAWKINQLAGRNLDGRRNRTGLGSQYEGT